jgi:perosamine synthetase
VNSVGVKFLPVAEPMLDGNEREYVMRCLESGWISGSGEFVNLFEQQFAEYCGTRHAITVANGTVALHLALLALDIGPGDEVIVPDLTYIASANAVTYCGAKPVFVDVDPVTWCIDVGDVERKITPATRAIMPVHLFGHPADMDPLCTLASAGNIHVVEDAAEAHGAEYKHRRIGGHGTIATFSFYGNKIITSGEGGMITTNDDVLAQRMRILRGQGMDPNRRYWFPTIGFNYRMTNVQAAIGVAQMERINYFVDRRRWVARMYQQHLEHTDITLPTEAAWAKNVFWLYSVCVPEDVDRDAIMADLAELGIETRPFFVPMHACPPYLDQEGDRRYPVSTRIANRGISLPSSATLDEGDIARVASQLVKSIQRQR